MKQETFDCLTLSLVPGLGTQGIHQLLREYGSAERILNLSAAQMTRRGLSAEIAAFIATGCARRTAEKTLTESREKGIHLLSLFDEEYPHLLKQIFDPPPVLYGLGNLVALRRPSIALVGSRRCSAYGREVTQKLARELAALGMCIVSGLARGIDSQAHIGALQGKGTTIAVLGNGVDVIYPRENRRLYRSISESGCVLSEFPCGSFPAPQNFPIRNRVISGLCYGTLITEASEFSGSLITARLTLEQNRELWAVPGNITHPGSYGPNYLIKQGAKVVLDKQDVLEELPPYVLDLLKEETKGVSDSSKTLTPVEEAILKLLSADQATHVDYLLRKSEADVSQLNQVLLQLEMKGLIRQWPGRQFSRRLE